MLQEGEFSGTFQPSRSRISKLLPYSKIKTVKIIVQYLYKKMKADWKWTKKWKTLGINWCFDSRGSENSCGPQQRLTELYCPPNDRYSTLIHCLVTKTIIKKPSYSFYKIILSINFNFDYFKRLNLYTSQIFLVLIGNEFMTIIEKTFLIHKQIRPVLVLNNVDIFQFLIIVALYLNEKQNGTYTSVFG